MLNAGAGLRVPGVTTPLWEIWCAGAGSWLRLQGVRWKVRGNLLRDSLASTNVCIAPSKAKS